MDQLVRQIKIVAAHWNGLLVAPIAVDLLVKTVRASLRVDQVQGWDAAELARLQADTDIRDAYLGVLQADDETIAAVIKTDAPTGQLAESVQIVAEHWQLCSTEPMTCGLAVARAREELVVDGLLRLGPSARRRMQVTEERLAAYIHVLEADDDAIAAALPVVTVG